MKIMICSPICLFFLISSHIVYYHPLLYIIFKDNLTISLLFNMSVIYWFSPNTNKISKQFFPVCNVMYNNVFNSFSILSVGYQCVLPIKSVEHKLNPLNLTRLYCRDGKLHIIWWMLLSKEPWRTMSHTGRCRWVPLEQIEKGTKTLFKLKSIMNHFCSKLYPMFSERNAYIVDKEM